VVIKKGEHFRINSDEKYQPFKLATEVMDGATRNGWRYFDFE